MMAMILIALTLALAFVNGANDVSKGIATLVGSGVAEYKKAVLWGSLWTVAGGLAAAFASQGLVAAFSGKGLLEQPLAGHAFLISVASGAILWVHQPQMYVLVATAAKLKAPPYAVLRPTYLTPVLG